ncbi:MAG: alkaline phosphatase family protein [Clostridia bacterium]|nr:alkaline phosphatase family protein [Clostridia bacterium]
MKNRKLVIISNDALVKEDMDYLLTKPLFQELVKKGTWVKTLKTIYPSVTYPCHTSMITGCYPNKTHLYNNEREEWGNPLWVWERKYNRVKTIIDAAKEKGMTTANVFWPVLGNDPNIDYNIPEYWSQTPDQPLTSALKEMGTSDKVIEEIVKPNLYYIEGHQRQHPYADEFVCACARDIILKYQPDVLVVHPAGIDGKRHGTGLFNAHVTEELDYTYYWMEKIIRAIKEVGEWDNTDFILTSDHGQVDIKRWGHPNILLVKAGLMTLDKDNNVTDYKAYVKSLGGSAQVYLKDKSDKEAYDLTYKTFMDAKESGLYGIERVYTTAECDMEEHLSGDFDFVLEFDGYTANGWEPFGPYFTTFDLSDYRTGRATHGFLPEKGPQPSMLMIGPDFNEGVTIERRHTLDMAATIAKIFDFNMPDIDGKPIEEAIKK